MWAFINEVVGWMPLVLCLWFILWPLSHVAFWREYRRLYPERPAPHGPATFLFRHYTGTREWHILTHRQAAPSLERRRRLFHAIGFLGVISVGLILLSSLRADPRSGPRPTTSVPVYAAPTSGVCASPYLARATSSSRLFPLPAVQHLPQTPEC